MVFQIRQKPTPLGHHDQESSPGGMVLLVRLEMLRQLRDTRAQQSNLNFWRSGIGLMRLIPCENLPLYFYRQRHSRVTAPCLLFISIWIRTKHCTAKEWPATCLRAEAAGS